MAGRPELTRAGRWRLGAVVLAVLVGHAVVLHEVSRLQMGSTLLKPMAPPMYTRVLVPEAPAPVPPAAAPAAPAPAPTKRLRAARPVPRKAPPPVAAASEPSGPAEPPTREVASAPSEAASAPAEPASAPASAAAAEAAAPEAAASTPAASAPAPTTPTLAGNEPAPGGWPPDTRLTYHLGGRFRSGQLYGNARVLWQRDAQRYQVRAEIELTFMARLVMTSQGDVAGDTLLPQVYEEVRNGKPRGLRLGESDVTLANGTVVPRPPGVQDTASQFVELSHRFATGRERLEVGRAITFWMARPGAVDLWTYDVVERETLATPLGDVEAFHLKPRPLANPRGNITAEMWFAPSLRYLPARIRVSMGDEAQIDLLVEAIDQR